MQPDSDRSVTHTVSVSVCLTLAYVLHPALPIIEGMIDDVLGMNCVFLPQADTHMHLCMAKMHRIRRQKKKGGNKACVVMLSLRFDGNWAGGEEVIAFVEQPV